MEESKAIASMGLVIYGGQRGKGEQEGCREVGKEREKEKFSLSSRKLSSPWNRVRGGCKCSSEQETNLCAFLEVGEGMTTEGGSPWL